MKDKKLLLFFSIEYLITLRLTELLLTGEISPSKLSWRSSSAGDQAPRRLIVGSARSCPLTITTTRTKLLGCCLTMTFSLKHRQTLRGDEEHRYSSTKSSKKRRPQKSSMDTRTPSNFITQRLVPSIATRTIQKNIVLISCRPA